MKQLYYSVEAETLLGHGGAQAEEAVEAFSDHSAPGWAFGDLADAQCDLVLVRLYSHDVDGAADAIRPVLELPASHRNNGIIVSAQRVGTALGAGPVRTAVAARDLRAEIEAFPGNRPALPRGWSPGTCTRSLVPAPVSTCGNSPPRTQKRCTPSTAVPRPPNISRSSPATVSRPSRSWPGPSRGSHDGAPHGVRPRRHRAGDGRADRVRPSGPRSPPAARSHHGFALRPQVWGRGYGTETLRLLLDFGFNGLGLHRIWGARSPVNEASAKTMSAVGMVEEGTIREHVMKAGRWRDSVVHAILDREFQPGS